MTVDMTQYTGGGDIPEAPIVRPQSRGASIEKGEVQIEQMRDAQLQILAEAEDIRNNALGAGARCMWCGRFHPFMYCPHITVVKWHDNGELAEIVCPTRQPGLEDPETGLIFNTAEEVAAAIYEEEGTHD